MSGIRKDLGLSRKHEEHFIDDIDIKSLRRTLGFSRSYTNRLIEKYKDIIFRTTTRPGFARSFKNRR